MGHIIPKLNLNKTPQAVDSNGLVFAKNIKVNTDGSLGRDNSISQVEADGRVINLSKITGNVANRTSRYLGHIVGVNSCIYFFMELVDTNDNNEVTATYYRVYEYNEVAETLRLVQCNWSYHGGKITGCVTTNNTNQKILTVSEYDCEELVPIKHINLSECKNTDDESIYTQNPNIPITNLHFAGYYSCTIPNGVYQFFVRYKVRDGFYTNWFPASKELYAGDAVIENTIQGTLKHVDITKDCDRSFVFEVNHLYSNFYKNYKEFQIGFVVSSNNATVARSWKSFTFGTKFIYFDYDKEFIEEVLLDDMLRTSYELYNARNVINYKNKLYLSNYIESDLNPDLYKFAKKINVSIQSIFKEKAEGTNYINGDALTLDNSYYVFADYNIKDLYLDFHFDVEKTDNDSTYKEFKELTSNLHPNYNYIKVNEYRLYAIYITSNNENYFIVGNQTILDAINTIKASNYDEDDYCGGTEPNDTTINISSSYLQYDNNNFEIYDIIKEYCSPLLIGINQSTRVLTYRFDINGTSVDVSEDDIHVVYISFKRTQEAWANSNWLVTSKLDIYEQVVTVKPKVFETVYTNQNNQLNTLLPYVHYRFYVHYVKSNGVVTNGYPIKELSTFVSDNQVDYDNTNGHYWETPLVLYPVFSNIELPDGYDSCFISILQINNNISQLINVNNTLKEADCLDLDALLYNINSKLTLIDNGMNGVEIGTGTYHSSNESVILNYFGAAGIVSYDASSSPKFIKYKYEVNDNNVSNLIRVTPFINSEDYDNYEDLNLPGFISYCTKLDRDVTKAKYISGLDIFDKTIVGASIEVDEIEEAVDFYYNEEFVYVYSKYNLNCLTLRENLNKGIRTWNETVDNTDVLKKQYIVSVNSQNCSLIYDLPLMYKEYTRRYYSVVDDKTFTVFDNTVRSSNVDIDEVFRSVYKFDAEDYYNVPTNRGIIVNLFSINNEIFVHTEHGLFKFTDSSLLKVGDNLYSSNKEVGVSESSPFEIGIAEIVDSQYGHGGLQNKEHALITFNGYIFYDSLVRNIYSYDNQSGIQNITSPVRKIIDWFEPTDVTFVSDDANNRFFITLSKVVTETIDDVPTDVKKVICLSYSFISKSFVSIHDINYDYAFNSRLNTYFIQDNNFLKVDYSDFGSYVNKYPSVLTIRDEATYNEDSVGSCIDIIINDGYEAIKALSHIHWICSSINDYVGENPYNVAEELIAEYGGDSIRVYSDQTWSDLLPINTEQNTQQINSANSYQYPRYNNGIWTMNYFRDIKNANSNYISDDMALIHGKYIVVRFIFGANKKNFKFENLNINFKNYEKV